MQESVIEATYNSTMSTFNQYSINSYVQRIKASGDDKVHDFWYQILSSDRIAGKSFQHLWVILNLLEGATSSVHVVCIHFVWCSHKITKFICSVCIKKQAVVILHRKQNMEGGLWDLVTCGTEGKVWEITSHVGRVICQVDMQRDGASPFPACAGLISVSFLQVQHLLKFLTFCRYTSTPAHLPDPLCVLWEGLGMRLVSWHRVLGYRVFCLDYASIVSCPNPTQLMQGERVWCHKSKSLGL